MYIPPLYAAPSDAACADLVRAHPLGTLVWQQAGRLEGKFKHGQDETERDQQGSAEALRTRGQHALADAMQR